MLPIRIPGAQAFGQESYERDPQSKTDTQQRINLRQAVTYPVPKMAVMQADGPRQRTMVPLGEIVNTGTEVLPEDLRLRRMGIRDGSGQ